MDTFAKTYFSNLNLSHKRTHAILQATLQPALERYQKADEDDAIAFRDKLNAFYKLYAFLSRSSPTATASWGEAVALRTLPTPYLRTDHGVEPINIANHVDLESYRLDASVRLNRMRATPPSADQQTPAPSTLRKKKRHSPR